jgi:exopolysaccharide biosynthesis polyprenyl glycosylphosphotransferase
VTLPLQGERLHDAAPPAHLVADVPGGFRLKLSQGDLVFFIDLWVLLGALWLSRLATGNLDPAVATFGVTALAFIVSPRLTRERLGASALDDAGPIFRRVCIAYAVGSTSMVLMDLSHHGKVLLAVAALTAPTLVVGRALAYSIERTIRREGKSARAVVVGGGEIARRLVTTLAEHDEYGLDVVGVIDDDPKLSSTELGTRVLGDLHALSNLVSTHRINVVIVAFSSSEHAGMVDVIRAAMANGAQVWVIPRFFELGYGSRGDHLWGLPVVRLQNPARSRPEWILKRTLDFVLAGLGLLVLSPLMAAIAALVYLESGRPIFFKQTRLGLDGREFAILKFRTMSVVEEELASVEWASVRTPTDALMLDVAADRQRSTRLGRFLRDTSLDELPQLFNVVRGDMSLVGPRPERPHFVRLFSEHYPNYGSRHRLPAGLTGWAQIHGLRGDTSIEERAAFDNYYIENWSLAGDLKILAKSVGVLSKMWR